MEIEDKIYRNNNIIEEFKKINRDSDKNLNLSLFFACIILFVYCYFGSFSFFEKTFVTLSDLDYWKIIYHNCMGLVLFFCLGIIFTIFILRKSPKDYGLAFNQKKLSLFIILIAIPVSALCGLFCVVDEQMSATYPLVDFNRFGTWYFILGYFVSYFLYYVGWEYLFRGLLLNASKEKMGIVGAILFTTLISALIHTSIGAFGKPMIETLSAIPAGIIFGYIAHKTKSIYPTLIIHFLIGLFTDLFIFLVVKSPLA